MPRYPNIWLLIAEELVLRRQYFYALRFWEKLLDERLELRDSFYDDVRNPNLRNLLGKPGEGSDFQARIGPLQPYSDPTDPGLSHGHQLHARFYGTSLHRAGKARMEYTGAGKVRPCFALPASVHYEVATEEETHPYVDSCPLCGITGEYSLPVDRDSEGYCLKIHDPLGVEFLLYGSVRGKRVVWPNGRPVTALKGLGEEYEITIREFVPGIDDCLRLGMIFLGPKGG
jgi:hypothetical protein